MSEHSRLLLDGIRHRLAAARRRVTTADALFGLVVTIGVLTALLALGAAIEAVFWLSSTARWVFVAFLAVIGVVLIGGLIARPLLRGLGLLPGLDDAALAKRIASRYPDVADRLTNLLDLADGRAATAPGPLLDSAVQMLGRQIQPVPFERVENLDPLRRAAPPAAAPLVGVLLALFLAPAPYGDALGRLLAPGASFAPPAPFAFILEPGDVQLVRGEDLQILARTQGTSAPRYVTLEISRAGEERVETQRVVAAEDGAFRHTESNLRADLRYRVQAEGVTSPWHRARVVARPVVRGLQLTLHPPRYTGLPSQRLAPDVGDFAALPGTRVDVSVSLGDVPVDGAALDFEQGGPHPLEVRGERASGAFSVARDDDYRVTLQSRDGHVNANPITHTVRTLTDAPPQIRLLAPGDGTLNESLVTRVIARVSDDFGFSRAALFFRLAERSGQAVESEFRALDLPIQPGVLDQDVGRDWLLGASGLGLGPGDVVAYYVEVWDNNSVAGYQSARTPLFTLRFPSVAEQFDRLDESEDAARDGLDDMRREADDARERFEELRQELLRKREAEWDDQRQLERLIEQHQRIDENVRQSVEQMQDILDQMRENDMVSEETRQLYQELQRVVEEIADPELMEQLRRLQEAMMEMNLQQMMQAMDQFQFDERQFRERIERALELFERLRTAKELEEAAARAADIARQEEALQEGTGELQDQAESGELSEEQQRAEQERLAEQQQRAQEAAEALRDQLRELEERMEKMRSQQGQQQMQQMQQELEDALQQMQQNQEQLQDGALDQARQGQQQLQQQMQRMQQMLQEMGQQMAGQQMERNAAGVRRVLGDVLKLSFDQEALRNRSSRERADSPAVRRSAQEQVDLASGLSIVADSLSALAREIPQMERVLQERAGTALRQMGEATEKLADRQPPHAASHQTSAMTSLNDLASLLSDLLDQMNNQGGEGGGMSMQQMMQQLQQMSGDQQMLNQQIQEMLNDIQGQRLSNDQQERLEQMRQQQEQIRQQLEELIRSGDLDAQTRSELQRIAEEMEAVSRQLQGGRLTREVRQRQEQILTRLLEARESLNQRGQKEEREGTPARDEQRDTATPSDLPPREEIDRLRRDLIRALESGYAPDYQELIKRYFDLLQRRADG